MTVKQLYEKLDARIPKSLSCEWDNDGLMCCPQPAKEVKKVLITLDVTAKAVRAAIDSGYDVIVSHHPMIFKGLKSINGENYVAEKVIDLIKNGISVFSFHTRLDAACGGVNDCLASLLALENVQALGECDIGRIGMLPSDMSARELAQKVKGLLGAEGVWLSDAGLTCRKVAVLGGSGGDDIDAAIALGADTYISGEFKYHSMTDAPEMKINLIEAGHFYTENPVCQAIADMIAEIDKTVECELYYSNRVRLI